MKHRSFFEPVSCLYCAKLLDAHMAVSADARPEPCDVSICAYCAEISEYAPDLQLVKLAEPRRAEVEANPDVIRAQRAIRAAKEAARG